MKRMLQTVVLLLGTMFLIGADSPETRVSTLGHQMMCMCSCGQILAECNHVGCTYSTRQLAEVREMVEQYVHGEVLVAVYGQGRTWPGRCAGGVVGTGRRAAADPQSAGSAAAGSVDAVTATPQQRVSSG